MTPLTIEEAQAFADKICQRPLLRVKDSNGNSYWAYDVREIPNYSPDATILDRTVLAQEILIIANW